MRSKWQPEPGRDYKFQAWDFHWKTPSIVKTANAYVFFLDFDFPCLKKFCFLPCRIVRTNLRFRSTILTYTVLIVTQNANGASNIGSIWFFYYTAMTYNFSALEFETSMTLRIPGCCWFFAWCKEQHPRRAAGIDKLSPPHAFAPNTNRHQGRDARLQRPMTYDW